ncbi:putative transposase [Variovorax paradoxus B4]|uniref:Putative transposase n=1 Tax=Variovorax paradoxus B4 TaxID=1246301 RepID=T1X6P9_VARPD|nr:putative transposase [Variovorax paradoxus B4]
MCCSDRLNPPLLSSRRRAAAVTNVGSDRSQLCKMALDAREAMGKTKLQAPTDRGYFNDTEFKACEDASIAPYVPKPITSPRRPRDASTRATSSIS